MNAHHNAYLATLCAIVGVSLMASLAPRAMGQDVSRQDATASADDADAAARRRILESDRWRRMERSWHEWLSVQKIYTADEVEKMNAQLAARAAQSSSRELEELLKEMDERLAVLLSPEAEEARQWVGQFLSVARNAQEQIASKRPDVANMTASQIRQELEQFRARQAATQQAQAAFDRTRGLQVQSALDNQAARRQAQAQAQQYRSQALAASQLRSRYAPPPRSLPNFTDFDAAAAQRSFRPYYRISPWGTPVRWNPLNVWW